ncbi:MAG: peptidase C25, partial [Thermoplasmata archaeon]|nr:peptidase C25 [Thermoplasmata archaeon]
MKRIIVLFVAGLFVLGNALVMESTAERHEKHFAIKAPSPVFFQKDGYMLASFPGEEMYLISPGKPMLPRILKVIELPFGVRNVEVEVVHGAIQEIDLPMEIMPSPSPMPLSLMEGFVPPPMKDEAAYGSHALYPPSWFTYRVGCGLNEEGEHVTFVTLNIYPIRYVPAEGKVYMAQDFDVMVRYFPPEKTLPSVGDYDMVIIAPSEFSSHLEKLMEHKNAHNVRTFIKTTEEIYAEYQGVDKAEQIKYFIKDAIEEHGIKYVLLVGGLKSKIYAKPKDTKSCGAEGWHVPVRYSNLISGEPGYPTDLYYADIYKEGGEFDSWDSNGNGIFAEWSDENGMPEDILDLYPDVYVGRFACRDVQEVDDLVNKIIEYENNAYGQEWFKRMLVVSGDGFLDQMDLNIQWDTNGLPNGEYTIYAQSIND